LTGIVLTLALIAALAAVWRRRLARRRVLAMAATLPGATPAAAIRLDGMGGLDEALRARRCICGGFLENLGERSERRADRVLRVVRAECRRCEREQIVYFDPGTVLH
jgi:hypothetical protein